MRDDVVAELRREHRDRSFQRDVGEGLDLAAVVADDVMVVRALDRRLEARDSVADLHPLDEPELHQRVEDAIHTGDADAPAAREQRVAKLLGAATAIASSELVDQRRSSAARTMTSRSERRLGCR